MPRERIKQHYIPQFILRKFAPDGYLKYFDVKTKKEMIRQANEIFYEKYLYTQELEIALSKYEREIAELINREFMNKDEAVLSNAEFDSLMLFLAIMSFRAKNTRNYFINLSEKDKSFFERYQPNRNFNDFWNRSLLQLCKYRSYNDLKDDKEIADIVRGYMERDAHYFHMSLVERRGDVDFIISDTYPTVLYGEIEKDFQVPIYEFFPISANRMIVLSAPGARIVLGAITGFNRKFFKLEEQRGDKKILRLCKMQEPEVKRVNQYYMEQAKEGYATALRLNKLD